MKEEFRLSNCTDLVDVPFGSVLRFCCSDTSDHSPPGPVAFLQKVTALPPSLRGEAVLLYYGIDRPGRPYYCGLRIVVVQKVYNLREIETGTVRVDLEANPGGSDQVEGYD